MDIKAVCCFFSNPCPGNEEANTGLVNGGANQGSTPLSWKTLQCTVGTVGTLGVVLMIGGGTGLLGKAALVTISAGVTGLSLIGCAVGRCVQKHLILTKAVEDLEKQTELTGSAVLSGTGALSQTDANQAQRVQQLQGQFDKVNGELGELRISSASRDKEIASLKTIIQNLTNKLTSVSVSFQGVLTSLSENGEASQHVIEAHKGMLANIQEIQQLLPQLSTLEQLPQELEKVDAKFDENFSQVQISIQKRSQGLNEQIANLQAQNRQFRETAELIRRNAQAIDDRDDKELEGAQHFHDDVLKDEQVEKSLSQDVQQLRLAVSQMLQITTQIVPAPSQTSHTTTSTSQNDKDLEKELEEVTQLTKSLQQQTNVLNDFNTHQE